VIATVVRSRISERVVGPLRTAATRIQCISRSAFESLVHPFAWRWCTPNARSPLYRAYKPHYIRRI